MSDNLIIGQRVTRFWRGEKYVFERVARREWVCVYQDSDVIPYDVVDSLGD